MNTTSIQKCVTAICTNFTQMTDIFVGNSNSLCGIWQPTEQIYNLLIVSYKKSQMDSDDENTVCKSLPQNTIMRDSAMDVCSRVLRQVRVRNTVTISVRVSLRFGFSKYCYKLLHPCNSAVICKQGPLNYMCVSLVSYLCNLNCTCMAGSLQNVGSTGSHQTTPEPLS